jgi:hypothetical protein
MKIRQGFVSNSSSSSFTCFEVAIKPNFQLTQEMVDAAWKMSCDYWCVDECDYYDGGRQKFDEDLREVVRTLKEGRSHEPRMDEYGDSCLHQSIVMIFDKFGGGMVVRSEESTEECIMTPMTPSEIKSRIEDLNKIMRFIKPSNNSRP